MDFGIFFVLGGLALATSLLGVILICQVIQRVHHRHKRNVPPTGLPPGRPTLPFVGKVFVCAFVLLAVLGHFAWQEFWLNESLVSAASSGDVAEVKRLLTSGADPGARWEDGKTARQLAAENGHPAIADLLRRAGG
ncbi:MAG: hypothetical protein C4321_07725 [Chloroflexota bacterium]